MKLFITLLLSVLFHVGFAQSTNQYFEKIRNNEAALTAFFSQMPKGGDLHHHYSGSIYAEPLLEHAISENFYLNTKTMQVEKEKSSTGNWEQFSTLKSRGELDVYKQKIMQKWSVKDYNHVDYPSDKLFFESFMKFEPAIKGNFGKGVLELKNRAITENVSYIETQLSTIPSTMNTDDLTKFNARLRQLALLKDEKSILKSLDSVYNSLLKKGATSYATDFNTNFVAKLHNELKIDDARFTMRYQNFVLRFMEPVDLFKNLVIAFISADSSPLMAGVNIVSPEDGETSMKDYWLHMVMFKYCHSRYPNVKYTMHAGELTLGLVQPEELTWHIGAAVYIAGANRIGHGVDMAYEQNSYDLLRYMAKKTIPIEINLVSNEFILKVKENRHPLTLYKEFGVPIVISTDDAGILRTNMTEQYVLLAKRYKDITYTDIKQFVYNSINYSFIKDTSVKKQLLKNIDSRFKTFESNFPMK
ncbi:amidohydrolase family protein [Flavobacterium gawalongense]|uniref:adenosine deaminase n=1 Tax=Flavobacterium gawalongense TaxID=2594432 RepID=A0A553BV96_9FLAO|nr:adenosine deaminase [Flavobacterium gawalongense]TRX02724.1 adenosine deaminase [Flavobacterium gawalongense]TRX08032.1 adenosine deaminase [Flavobacterium gawalongense]TRX10931.1 adenosine deaminase [Flavobacterium gawalongense]TRX12177.1 adenosine deaminase [Flavobacterium gawalongense]TRX25155.1 adenosine deaminase [Flavobacterium gawalongense]